MDALDEQLAQLKLLNSRPLSPRVINPTIGIGSVGANGAPSAGGLSPKKVGPAVPPKPNKKLSSSSSISSTSVVNSPQVPQSIVVKQTCEPLYSKRLQSDTTRPKPSSAIMTGGGSGSVGRAPTMLHRKLPNYGAQHHVYSNIKMTLDNPAILDQQLEALEHHKRQLEKKGLMPHVGGPKLTSASFVVAGKIRGSSASPQSVDSSSSSSGTAPHFYSNLPTTTTKQTGAPPTVKAAHEPDIVYSNIVHRGHELPGGGGQKRSVPIDLVYSNVGFGGLPPSTDDLPPPPPLDTPPLPPTLNLTASGLDYLNQTSEDELPPPPSPVSSSYSELRRATDNFPKMPGYPMQQAYGNGTIVDGSGVGGGVIIANSAGGSVASLPLHSHASLHSSVSSQGPQAHQTYMNTSYHNDYSTYGGPSSQGSTTYESIYEPINPRPQSQLSSRSNYSLYTSYVNGLPSSSSGTHTPLGQLDTDGRGSSGVSGNGKLPVGHKEAEVEALTDLLVHSMDPGTDVDSYGDFCICVKCGDRVVGENSGCTAMDQIYHIACFTCSQCQINLQGKPFYSLEGKPYCEEDYLNTLEKCSVCMKPILERILRATGKPYHPQCFTCVVCGNSLDGIPFTVDATNQNYCIEDFHKKFAPRCCVCRQPIMPEPGQEETVRVVALDRSFHFECYKCEDCGLLLSSEAEGRGCYPLDDHVLCKSCNAQRVQALTNRMTTDL